MRMIMLTKRIPSSSSFLKHKQLLLQHLNNRHCNGKVIQSLTTTKRFRSSSSSTEEETITFLTDIEGDKSYFHRYIHTSQLLSFQHISPRFHFSQPNNEQLHFPYSHQIIFNSGNNTTKLVYGGDVCDKNGHDLYVLRQLLSLRRRYGEERVVFLMGNRDVNKMRILNEMGLLEEDNGEEEEMPFHGGVYWLRGSGLMGDPTLCCHNDDDDDDDDVDVELRQKQEAARVPTKPSDRLKWILSKTMGSPNAFALRKQEIQEERLTYLQHHNHHSHHSQHSIEKITDKDVVQSYISTCHPTNGLMGQYLQKAKLVYKNDSALFLHGALPYRKSDYDDNGGVINLRNPYCSFLNKDKKEQEEKMKQNKTREKKEKIKDDEKWVNYFNFAMPWKTTTTSANTTNDAKTTSSSSSNTINNPEKWIQELNNFAKYHLLAWQRHVQHLEKKKNDDDDISQNSKNNNNNNTKKQNDSKIGVWSTKGGYDNTILSIGNTTTSVDVKKEEKQDDTNYGPLLQYGMGWTPNSHKNPTVVYNSWLTDGMPRKFYSKEEGIDSYRNMVHEFCKKANVQVILSGHQPHGDLPVPIRLDTTSSFSSEEEKEQNKPCLILCCDTSYSGDTHWIYPNGNGEKEQRKRENLGRGNGISGRGDVAVSEVLIRQCTNTGEIRSVSTHGVLSDGSSYESVNLMKNNTSATADDDDSVTENDNTKTDLLVVGTAVDPSRLSSHFNEISSLLLSKGVNDDNDDDKKWWVKSKFQDGSYLLAKGRGYNVWNTIVKPQK